MKNKILSFILISLVCACSSDDPEPSDQYTGRYRFDSVLYKYSVIFEFKKKKDGTYYIGKSTVTSHSKLEEKNEGGVVEGFADGTCAYIKVGLDTDEMAVGMTGLVFNPEAGTVSAESVYFIVNGVPGLYVYNTGLSKCTPSICGN